MEEEEREYKKSREKERQQRKAEGDSRVIPVAQYYMATLIGIPLLIPQCIKSCRYRSRASVNIHHNPKTRMISVVVSDRSVSCTTEFLELHKAVCRIKRF